MIIRYHNLIINMSSVSCFLYHSNTIEFILECGKSVNIHCGNADLNLKFFNMLWKDIKKPDPLYIDYTNLVK